MKRLSYLFVLFFAYFICVINVYASINFSCRLVENNGVSLTSSGCTFTGQVRSNNVYHGYGPNGSSSFVNVDYIDYSDGTYVNYYNLFGYYNDGNLVGYSRPPGADNWTYRNGLYLWHLNEAYTSSLGNVEYYTFFEYTEYVDVVWGNNDFTHGLNRLDFALHLNLTSIPQNVRKNILGNLSVDVTMPTIGGSYCTATYNNDIIRVSCSFDYNGEEPVVRIRNNVPADYNYNSSVNTYTYQGYFDVSEWTSVKSLDSDPYNLGTSESPNGNDFNDYYDYIQSNSNDWFNSTKFQYPTIDSVSSIVLSPLRLINYLQPTSQSSPTLDFNLFNKNISVESGYVLFWGKCSSPLVFVCPVKRRLTSSYILGSQVTASRKVELITTFNNFWNVLFGGAIIYYLGKKCVRVSMKTFNPDKAELEVL